jgi:uncharacterized LabA/DUF88 family protein
MRPFRKKPVSKPKGVYAFVDSQNLNLGTQKVGWKMDWKKLHEYLKTEYGVTRAYLFIGYIQENTQMYEGLHDMGYSIVLKPTVSVTHKEDDKAKDDKADSGDKKKDTPHPPVKGNVDAELVLYAMKEMPNYSKAIIVSGDGDFYCLAEYLASKDRLKHIMTPNRYYSSLLKPYEEYIVRIDELRRELAYKDFKRRGSGGRRPQNGK